MNQAHWSEQGVHKLMIPGPAGELEAMLEVPGNASANNCWAEDKVMVICHPHPLYQGSMHNKVVTTLARASKALGLRTLRFNFRGVGRSTGEYGEIEGECDDARAVSEWLQSQWPSVSLLYSGFSFGCFPASCCALEQLSACLLLVAPSIERMPYDTLDALTMPTLLIQGEADDVVSPGASIHWAKSQSQVQLECLADAGHFFHGRLAELESLLVDFLMSLSS